MKLREKSGGEDQRKSVISGGGVGLVKNNIFDYLARPQKSNVQYMTPWGWAQPKARSSSRTSDHKAPTWTVDYGSIRRAGTPRKGNSVYMGTLRMTLPAPGCGISTRNCGDDVLSTEYSPSPLGRTQLARREMVTSR